MPCPLGRVVVAVVVVVVVVVFFWRVAAIGTSV